MKVVSRLRIKKNTSANVTGTLMNKIDMAMLYKRINGYFSSPIIINLVGGEV